MSTPRLSNAVALRPEIAEDSTIKVIGLGGVGSIAARYAAIFLASLQRRLRLVLVDGDAFEPANASRMLFPTCGNKAAVVCDELLEHFTDSLLAVVAVEEYVTPDNIERLIQPGDSVLLAVDNHATRKLVDDFCAKHRDDVCLISGGNDGIEPTPAGNRNRGTFGNVQIFVRRGGKNLTPPLSAFHPEIANPAGKLPTELNCTELVASSPQILFANLLTASSMLNALWLYLCGHLHYSEAVFDIGEALMRPVETCDPVGSPAHVTKAGNRKGPNSQKAGGRDGRAKKKRLSAAGA